MPVISTVLLAAFLALVTVSVWHELRAGARTRREAPGQPSPSRRQTSRRLLGLLFLALAVAILVNSSTFDRYVTNPFYRLAWIGMALVSVLFAVWLALRDLSETGRMAQREATRAVLESLTRLQSEIERVKQDKSKAENTGPGDTARRPSEEPTGGTPAEDLPSRPDTPPSDPPAGS